MQNKTTTNRRRKRQHIRMTVADPLPDLPRIRPKFSMLEREDCSRIHQASLDVLKRTGVHVYSESALALLREAGATVEGKLVKISPSLVKGALASVPDTFNLYKRGTDEVALQLDGRSVYFGPGSDTLHYLDPQSGDRRDFLLSDIADCTRLCDAIPEISFMMSVPAEKITLLVVAGYNHYQLLKSEGGSIKPFSMKGDALKKLSYYSNN